MNLSDRLRPHVEAAPWVIDEIKKLEAERDAAVARYEYVRRLNVPRFQELFVRCFKGERFDDLVDAGINALEEDWARSIK